LTNWLIDFLVAEGTQSAVRTFLLHRVTENCWRGTVRRQIKSNQIFFGSRRCKI